MDNIGFPGVHKIDIQQGNLITDEMVELLRPGLTQNQVQYVMGTPLVVDTFNPNHWDYVYHLVGDEVALLNVNFVHTRKTNVVHAGATTKERDKKRRDKIAFHLSGL
jgi:outer membrane protein assembly factor BamE (lipoprotein component of BamABCDE complex)